MARSVLALLFAAALLSAASVDAALSIPPRPPSPPVDDKVELSRASYRLVLLNDYMTDIIDVNNFTADTAIAIARAFLVPEEEVGANGVFIREVRMTTADDLENTDWPAAFINGTLIDFDTDYPSILAIPGSVNVVTTWTEPIVINYGTSFQLIAVVDKADFTVFGSDSSSYKMYLHSATHAQASTFCKKLGATIASIALDEDEIYSSMACNSDGTHKCWVKGASDGQCMLTDGSTISEAACDDTHSTICYFNE
eukprot:gene28368-31496_t